jgi:hypothetical protein
MIKQYFDQIRSSALIATLTLSMGLGAFLVFFIQPMMSKAILPYLGGSSSIWATSLAFFTTSLFLGYLYAYYLSKHPIKKQITIHRYLLIASLILLCVNAIFSTPVFLPVDWFAMPNNPASSILVFLAVSIGLPYILLSATAPLLQQWFAHETGHEPYILYSVSNIGSLVALLAYPFLIEPYLPLYMHTVIWFVLFLIFAWSLYYVFTHLKTGHEEKHEPAPHVPKSTFYTWVALTALPAAILVAGTTYITQVVAPVPLLWIIPLTLYLISFIIAFGGFPIGPTLVIASGFSLWQTLNALLNDTLTVQGEIFTILVTIFLVSTTVHQYVFTLRPDKRNSSWFYVATSLGGAVGSVLASIVAPITLSGMFELHIALILTSVVLAVIFVKKFLTPTIPNVERNALVVIACVYALMFAQDLTVQQRDVYGVRERNFYGVTRVYEGEETRRLYHGTTLHGEQFIDEARELLPTSYYSHKSGVGRAILEERKLAGTKGIRVGTIGLGTGTIASYCRPEDTFVFYEIDQRMVTIAEQDFSFVNHCENIDIRMGDGRITVTHETTEEPYDVLAIDAFSDDSVPMHLITKEAIEGFLDRVSDDGILAVHTSNRYLDLGAVVIRIADELNIPVGYVNDDGEEEGASSSTWLLLSRNPERLSSTIVDAGETETDQTAPLWTDEHINIFPILYNPISITSWITDFFHQNDQESDE